MWGITRVTIMSFPHSLHRGPTTGFGFVGAKLFKWGLSMGVSLKAIRLLRVV
jgi:hypothetical protein